MNGETVNVGGSYSTPTPGTAGVNSQVGGAATTVSSVAGATGGIDAGNLVERDLDQELFKFKSDDTPLMQLMLKAKKVKVQKAHSPVLLKKSKADNLCILYVLIFYFH